MDLEKINEKYTELKSKLEAANKSIEKMKENAQNLAEDKIIQRSNLIKAKRNGDKTAEQDAQKEMERIDKELEKIKKDAAEKAKEIEGLQLKLNEKIEEIKQNPEMKKHLEEVLSKKYERKLSKLQDEREEVVGKKDRLIELQKLVTDHPSLGNNLKGILGAQKEIDDLNKELESLKDGSIPGQLVSYKDPARANEIMTKLLPEAQNRLNTNKTTLMSYITKKSLEITEQDIDELAKGFVVDGKGNMDLNGTINKSISGLNRQIKGYDKSIRNHEIAVENLGRTPATKTSSQPAAKPANKESILEGEEEQAEEEEPQKWYQKFKNWINPEKEEPEAQPKQKWYQKLVQGLKNWNEQRKQKALPEPEEKETASKTESKSTKNDFKDSLKYDIVKDIVEQMEVDGRKEAKKDRKAESKQNNESAR